MTDNFSPLEQHLRDLPTSQDVVTLTFEHIERILHAALPRSAHEDSGWWGNQKPGMNVESIAWMDAGWMVENVDLREQLVRFVRQ